ncbi:Piso0_002250 [Millerozyma farinosa CBS 7064]|uniref:Piso0_002250 protein n=1 Tax=Pichia sorbitophila (strain ATCC MYA-4447 / BCRC 22081 / CBS 7064 / NBRC 10061 / NRRL Y-12695) TaxID=559304 RepID=G8YEJ0_PICSO|nr:Piso0_002250 [Millerozyma farinosa CBS 7064]
MCESSEKWVLNRQGRSNRTPSRIELTTGLSWAYESLTESVPATTRPTLVGALNAIFHRPSSTQKAPSIKPSREIESSSHIVWSTIAPGPTHSTVDDCGRQLQHSQPSSSDPSRHVSGIRLMQH